MSHLDTVHPVGTAARDLPVRVEDDRLYGPGVYDMKGGACLAFEAFKAAAQRLDAAAEAWRGRYAGGHADPAAADALNACLKRLSRLLLPLASTMKGAYGHDPYGFTPQASMIPGLHDLPRFASLAAGEERWLLETQLVRERNRVMDGLADAEAEVARNEVAYALLRADADGTVVDTLAEPGQVVAAGQTVVKLAHAGPREATVNLPETVRPAIGSPAQARLYGAPSAPSPARLRQLADAADPAGRSPAGCKNGTVRPDVVPAAGR